MADGHQERVGGGVSRDRSALTLAEVELPSSSFHVSLLFGHLADGANSPTTPATPAGPKRHPFIRSSTACAHNCIPGIISSWTLSIYVFSDGPPCQSQAIAFYILRNRTMPPGDNRQGFLKQTENPGWYSWVQQEGAVSLYTALDTRLVVWDRSGQQAQLR